MDRFSTYDLAYTFKKSKLWQLLREQQVFAVSLPNGQIAYCLIMGQNGEHMALSVHIDAEGFSTLRRMQELDQEPVAYEDMFQQDCIQCSIEKRDQFSSEELNELRSYCKDRGIPFRAPFPQFARFKRYCFPWMITDDGDWDAIHTVLTIVAKIIETIEKRHFASLAPRMIYADTEGEYYLDGSRGPVTIPLYSIEDGALKAEQIPLPAYVESRIAPPTAINEVSLRKLMKMQRGGILQCEIIRGPEPVQGEPPYLPALLMTVIQEDGLVLTPIMPKGVDYNPNEMVDGLLGALVSAKLYPDAIMARTEETLTILKPFCKKAKIKLVESNELDELDDAIDAMMERMEASDDSQTSDVLDALQQMSIEQIKALPDFMLEQMLQLGDVLPKMIIDKIKAALK